VATGVFTAVNVAFNNSSLVYLSLSMNQVITASMPVLTCCFAICIEKVWILVMLQGLHRVKHS
jgi:branched-subunit amino acid permease